MRNPWVVLKGPGPADRIAATPRGHRVGAGPRGSEVGPKGVHKREMTYRCGVSKNFELPKCFHDFVRACAGGRARRVGARPGLLRETIYTALCNCTPHGLAQKVFTATLARASRGNCSLAQKSSVWLYLNRCVTARKTHPWRGGQSHHDHAHQRTPSQAQHPGTNLGHPFGVLHPVLDPWTSPAIRGGQCQQTNDKPAFQQHVDNHPKKNKNEYIYFFSSFSPSIFYS